MQVKIAELIEDMDLYPRHAVDDRHVSQIALALEAGEKLPPIVVDRKSKRTVDGFHRVRAVKRVHGPEASIEVEWKEYSSQKEMILDAIRLNSHHGRRLDSMDQVRAIIMAEAVGCSAKVIAAALCVPQGRVELLRIRVANVAPSVESAVPHSSTVALKRPVFHMAGKRLTKEQAEAHQSMPGTSFELLCMQLIKAMDHDLIDRENVVTMKALHDLRAALIRYLKNIAA